MTLRNGRSVRPPTLSRSCLPKHQTLNRLQRLVPWPEVSEQFVVGWRRSSIYLLGAHFVKNLTERTLSVEMRKNRSHVGARIHRLLKTRLLVLEQERQVIVLIDDLYELRAAWPMRLIGKERNRLHIAIKCL